MIQKGSYCKKHAVCIRDMLYADDIEEYRKTVFRKLRQLFKRDRRAKRDSPNDDVEEVGLRGVMFYKSPLGTTCSQFDREEE